MEELLLYFENLQPPFRFAIFMGGMLLFWVLEGIIPLKAFKRGQFKNLRTNIYFTVLGILSNLALASVLFFASHWAAQNEFGFFYLFEGYLWVKVVATFLIVDFVGIYLPHVAEHKIPWLWRIHAVHHSDPRLGITSALRQHPLQTIYHVFFTALGIALAGAPIAVVLFYQTLYAIWGQMVHSNIKWPGFLERSLSWVFITPNIHKVHHHYKMPMTDSNYGGTFSIWDRLFGTLIIVKNQEEILYGVDTYWQETQKNEFIDQLILPFKPVKGRAADPDVTSHASNAELA